MQVLIVIFIIIFVCTLVVNIKRFIENENSPVVTENAYLRKKINDTHMDANGVVHSSLLLLFDIDGNTIKCVVPGRVYRAVNEGTYGLLTHQGTRFKCFEFNGIKVEK